MAGIAGKSGRKSLREEIELIRYMKELSAPTFNYLKLCIESGDKEDKQWGVEQMMKLYPKVVPQEITGEGGEALKIQIIHYGDKDTLPVDPGTTPTPDTAEQVKIQGDSVASESP